VYNLCLGSKIFFRQVVSVEAVASRNEAKKSKSEVASAAAAVTSPTIEHLVPLTFDEQEALAEDINNLPDHLLSGAMDIIRQADVHDDDDDEIDLDLDMFDIKTQRKLQLYILSGGDVSARDEAKKAKSGVALASDRKSFRKSATSAKPASLKSDSSKLGDSSSVLATSLLRSSLLSSLERVLKQSQSGITLQSAISMGELLPDGSAIIAGSTIVQACLGQVWKGSYGTPPDVDIFCSAKAAPQVRSVSSSQHYRYLTFASL
jgi:hypothetical protein